MSLHISQRFQKGSASVTVSLHDLKTVRSGSGSYGNAWVEFKDDAGHEIALHVDGRLAEMIADAFAEYENWLSSQEGPTFDDALAAKCDAKAREDAGRALK